MGKYKEWHARCSALGGYAGCTMRAWLDNGLMTGRLHPVDWGFKDKAAARGPSSPPADYGTCAHWFSQTSLRCQFMPKDDWNNMTYTGWDAETCKAAKYEDDQFTNGASMFSTPTEADDMLVQIAKNIKQYMPRKRKGADGGKAEWMAEPCFEIPNLLNGHIDFLSDDHRDIVDLKTTGSKPSKGKAKPSHVWQLFGYALGVFHATGTLPERGHILYAHSRGEWAFRTKPIQFHSRASTLMFSQLLKRLQLYANYDQLEAIACPSFGSACEDFCPYTHCCRDAIIPKGIAIRDQVLSPLTSSNPFA